MNHLWFKLTLTSSEQQSEILRFSTPQQTIPLNFVLLATHCTCAEISFQINSTSAAVLQGLFCIVVNLIFVVENSKTHLTDISDTKALLFIGNEISDANS
eukprot:UN00767